MGMIPVRPARPDPKIRAPCRRPTEKLSSLTSFFVQNAGKNVENWKSHWKNTNWIWKSRWKWKSIHTNWWKMAKMDGNECKNTNHGVRWAEFHSNSNSEWWKSPWTNWRWWGNSLGNTISSASDGWHDWEFLTQCPSLMWIYKVGPPSYVWWFINPIDYSYRYHKS